MLQGVTFEGQPEMRTGEKLDTKITVRSSSGPFTAENQPLYVLNGEVVNDGNLIKTMDPNTIESMNVLKGETATKLYGSKGANGVISIVTKNK